MKNFMGCCILGMVLCGISLISTSFTTESTLDTGYITFENNDYDAKTLTIWYSDWNNQWEEIYRSHLVSGEKLVFKYQQGQLQYYGYSTDGGVTIKTIHTNYVYLE